MKGQYSDSEFIAMLKKAGIWRSSVDYTDKTAWIKIGNTTNYYRQCADSSWLNYSCNTN